jgi:hypothetical protein
VAEIHEGKPASRQEGMLGHCCDVSRLPVALSTSNTARAARGRLRTAACEASHPSPASRRARCSRERAKPVAQSTSAPSDRSQAAPKAAPVLLRRQRGQHHARRAPSAPASARLVVVFVRCSQP